jgi:putative YhbY family RNA-binding protein
MAELALTPKQRQALKGRAHGLKPVVLLGAAGLSPAVLCEIDRALAAHELIKVKVPGDDREQREAIFATVADRLAAARVQAIGKLLVLFRPAPADEAPASERTRQAAGRGRSSVAPAAQRRDKARSARPSKANRADVERVQRGTVPRRDPGKAHRAAGRSNAPRGKRGR